MGIFASAYSHVSHIIIDLQNLWPFIWEHYSNVANFSFIQIVVAVNLGFHTDYIFKNKITKYEDRCKNSVKQVQEALITWITNSMYNSNGKNHNEFLYHLSEIGKHLFGVLNWSLGKFVGFNNIIYLIIKWISWISVLTGALFLAVGHRSNHYWILGTIWFLYFAALNICQFISWLMEKAFFRTPISEPHMTVIENLRKHHI